MANRSSTLALLLLTSCVFQPQATPLDLGIVNLSVTPNRLIAGSVVQLSLSVTQSGGAPASGLVVQALVNNGVHAAQSVSNTTDAQGLWQGALQDLAVGNYNINAQVSHGGTQYVVVGDDKLVQVVKPGNVGTVSSSTASVQSGGSQSVGATFTDALGNPLAGETVTFTASPDDVLELSSTTGVTDAQGHVSVQATATVAGNYTVTITDSTGVSTSTTVTVLPGPASAALSTLSVNPTTVAADGIAAATVVVQVSDAYGNSIPDQAVTFTASGAGSALSVAQGSTHDDGTLTSQLTSETAGAATVTAIFSGISKTASVTFTASTAGHVVVNTLGASTTADGTSSITAVATVTNGQGNPVSGVMVTFNLASGTAAFTPTQQSTTSFGTASTKVTSTVAGPVTLQASAGGVSGLAAMTFVAGSPANLVVSEAPATVPADGVGAMTFVATVTDAHNNPVPSTRVTIAATGTNNVFSPASSGNTTTSGTFTASLASTTAENKTITVTAGSQTSTLSAVFTSASSNASVSVTPTSGLVTSASGSSASFTVALTAQPTSPVTMSFSSSNPNAVYVYTSALTFTSTNWSTPQAVLVQGQSIGVYGGSSAVTIASGGTVSSDGRYDGLVVPSVTVTNNNLPVPTVQPLYSNASLWNTWVVNDGSSAYSASNTPCTGSESGNYAVCLHGAEMLYVGLTDTRDCNNVVATDSLGAFNWICENATGHVRIISSGLKTTAGLSTLLDFNNTAWVAEKLTVQRAGTTLFTTAGTNWWSNPITPINASSFFLTNMGAVQGLTLSQSNNVYAVNQNVTFAGLDVGITINANNISLAVKPNLALTGGNTLVSAPGRAFLWFEGTFNGTATTNLGLSLPNVTQAVVRHGNFSNFLGPSNPSAIWSGGGKRLGVFFSNFQNSGATNGVTECGSPAIGLSAVIGSVFQGLNFTGSVMVDIAANISSNNVIQDINSKLAGNTTICSLYGANFTIKNVDAWGTNEAIDLKNGVNNVISQLYVANSTNSALYLVAENGTTVDGVNSFNSDTGAAFDYCNGIRVHNGVFAQAASGNPAVLVLDTIDSVFTAISVLNAAGDSANGAFDVYSSTYNVFQDLAIAGAASRGFYLDGESKNNTVLNLAVSNANTAIQLDPNSANYFRGAIAVGSSNNECLSPNRTGTGLVTASGTATTAGYGACVVDGANPNTSITHTLDVSTAFVGFVASDVNNTTVGTLGNYAYNPNAMDWFGFIRPNRGWGAYDPNVIDPNGKMKCGVYANQSPNCRVYDFNLGASDFTIRARLLEATNGRTPNILSHTWSTGLTTTFIMNFAEVSGGNGDFLCQSSETCIYTPNYGAYQGHGPVGGFGVTATTDTVAVAVLNVWSINGY